MKLGIIISTDDAETCWNALRFASFGLKQGDEARVFLIGRGVDYQRDSSGKFNTTAQGEDFLKAGGEIFACGTCIKSRSQEGSELCPISTMKDLYDIVKESDRVVSF
jgi:uncharacterized protein involved in oxidation of intracellular sulfur